MRSSVICLGEVLWDVFPDGQTIGGAPLNVAYHLNKLGIESQILSKVGKDEEGVQLTKQIQKWGLKTELIQMTSMHPTGKAIAYVEDDGDTTYDIVKPAAWDFIEQTEKAKKAVDKADAVVFGSLVMRNQISRETIFELIKRVDFCVLDVNLRPPHYSSDLIIEILEKVDLLKLNHQELDQLTGWIRPGIKTEEKKAELLLNQFHVEEILVTKGSDGATYYHKNGREDIAAFPVDVVDTVGSGDAFLAGFLAGKFKEGFPKVADQLKQAALLGAFVAGHNGACPDYDLSDLKRFDESQII